MWDSPSNWKTQARVGSWVSFIDTDTERGVVAGQVGRVVWSAGTEGHGRDVELADGRTVNIPCYRLNAAREPKIVIPAHLRHYILDMAAHDGRMVCQGHADVCELLGHGKNLRNGVEQGTCPRCGVVTA